MYMVKYMEFLSVIFALIGVVMVVGTFTEMTSKGIDNYKSEDALIGFGIGSLLIFLSLLLN